MLAPRLRSPARSLPATNSCRRPGSPSLARRTTLALMEARRSKTSSFGNVRPSKSWRITRFGFRHRRMPAVESRRQRAEDINFMGTKLLLVEEAALRLASSPPSPQLGYYDSELSGFPTVDGHRILRVTLNDADNALSSLSFPASLSGLQSLVLSWQRHIR